MCATMQSLNFIRQSDKLIKDRINKVMAHMGFDAGQSGSDVHDRAARECECLRNTKHEQVVVREGRGEVELQLLHVRNEIGR